uniref:Uncharacterized protein n=1 Tax=Oryza rufipogon TaxID=4529 RepID=A0A0E0R032_ORYRU
MSSPPLRISTAGDALPLRRSPSPSPHRRHPSLSAPFLLSHGPRRRAAPSFCRRRPPPSRRRPLLSDIIVFSGTVEATPSVSASATTSSLRRTVGRSPSRHDLGAAELEKTNLLLPGTLYPLQEIAREPTIVGEEIFWGAK